MAEHAIVGVLGRLMEFLAEETVSVCELRDQVKAVEDELRGIKCFLKDADSQIAKNESIKNWVDNLCKVAYELEDVIDTFLVEIDRYYHQKDLKGKTKRLVHMLKEMIDRHKISSKIVKTKEKLHDINNRRKSLGIKGIDERADPRRQTLLERRIRDAREEYQPNDVVGIEVKIKELVKQLVEGDKRRCVISVVGQAGVGKTVLARNVFNRVKSSFWFSAWIHVPNSKHNTSETVFREMCKAVGLPRDEIKELSEGDMLGKIARKLKEEKYLVALDDVWSRETWDAIRGALPDGNMGSRVLMTTRIVGVAKQADARTRTYEHTLMNKEDSYKLFCRHAFPRSPHSCPLELKSLATHIVERCGRLPLALVAVGGILSGRKPTDRAWKDFMDGFNWDLMQGNAAISSILDLSFDDLRSELKPCLLYCCAFPGDSEIRVRRLLRLWIAEGFVERQGDRQPEAIAMHYLDELVDRHLIQPCKSDSFGEIKSCQVHNVLRETLATTARNQNVFQILPTANNHDLSNCRRLAVHRYDVQPKTLPMQLARSFISFAESEPPIWYDQLQNFKLLRILDLEGVRSVNRLPTDIGDLVLLRYLSLRHTSIETLPRSTKNLHHLQTFDLRTSNVRLSQYKLSFHLRAKHVGKMTNLRHLYFGNGRCQKFNAMDMPDDFGANGTLNELQTLSYVKAGGWVEKGLCTMMNLRKLGIQVQDGDQSRSTLTKISKLSHLHNLYLQGKLEDLQTDALGKLTKLTLDFSCLQKDPFSSLQKLQSLKSLKLLNNAYIGITMSCSKGGFPSLQVLNLENLEHLAHMLVESTAFLQLKYMRIASCNKLDKIPPGLQNVGSLQELKLVDMAGHLVERLQPGRGEDWQIISHIQSTIITTSAAESENSC